MMGLYCFYPTQTLTKRNTFQDNDKHNKHKN
jgi:hypothetical protein